MIVLRVTIGKSLVVVGLALGVFLVAVVSRGGQSQSFHMVSDVLSSSGGTVGSAGYSVTFTCSEPATVGLATSGNVREQSGFIRRVFHPPPFSAAVGEDNAGLPSETMLRAVLPNPFSSTTSIAFSVASPGETRLEIYDVEGRKVRTVGSGYRSAGSFAAIWDGCDDDGVRLSPGVYFCVLESGDVRRTRKLVVVK